MTATATLEDLQRELHRRDLKIKALLEDITATREQNADARVEITYLTTYSQQLEVRLNEMATPESGSTDTD